MRGHKLAALFLLLPLVCAAKVQAMEIARDTSVIGTPEQPTIEGGFIHQADVKCHKNAEKKTAPLSIYPAKSRLPDELGDNDNLKQLLTAAARDHQLAYVLQRANQLKLPASVALIPMVESHYQTHAISPKGASGAWQLMPETAKEYGLNSQARTLFTASTDAALHLLNDLHQQFGNWTLAFAAYNAGSGRVDAALRHCPHARFIEDLDLPLETRRYVYRLKQLQQTIAQIAYSND